MGLMTRLLFILVGDLKHRCLGLAPTKDSHCPAAAAAGDLGSVQPFGRPGLADQLNQPVGAVRSQPAA